MKWFKPKRSRDAILSTIMADAKDRGKEISAIFKNIRQIRTASSGRQDVHLYIDPNLVANYNVNLHLIGDNNGGSTTKETKVENIAPLAEKKTAAAKDSDRDFLEESVPFPSKQGRDPNYLCHVVFQKPEEDVYSVSAYLMETYLGQYAFKSNYYFRASSKDRAKRCFERVAKAVKDLQADIMDGSRNQNAVPYLMKRALQGEVGEVEHKRDKVANYLDPSNVPPQKSVGAENILTIPTERSIKDDLVFSRKPENDTKST